MLTAFKGYAGFELLPKTMVRSVSPSLITERLKVLFKKPDNDDTTDAFSPEQIAQNVNLPFTR